MRLIYFAIAAALIAGFAWFFWPVRAIPGLCTDQDRWQPETLKSALADCDERLQAATGRERARILGSKSALLNALQKPLESGAALAEAMRADPGFPDTHCRYGWSAMSRDDAGAAEMSFDRCAALGGSAEAIAARGLARYFLRRPEEALSDADAALAMDQDLVIGLLVKVMALEAQKKCDEAMPVFEKFFGGPNSVEAQALGSRIVTTRARCLEASGRIEEAGEEYFRAIRWDHTDHLAYYARGLFFQTRGKHDDAIEDFSRAIALRPSYRDAYEARALSYLILEKEDLAEADRTKLDALTLAR